MKAKGGPKVILLAKKLAHMEEGKEQFSWNIRGKYGWKSGDIFR